MPVIWFGIYDKEVSYQVLEEDPRYYIQGIIGKLFHPTRFWKWVIFGMIHGFLVFIFSFYGNKSPIYATGCFEDLWSSGIFYLTTGSIAYSSIVLIVNLRIVNSTFTHSVVSIGLFLVSVLLYYVFLSFMSLYYKFENFNNFYMLFSSGNFFISTVVLLLCCFLLDVGVGKLLILFGIVRDPLSLTAEDTELKKNEMKVIYDENVVNNAFTGAAFSEEHGKAIYTLKKTNSVKQTA